MEALSQRKSPGHNETISARNYLGVCGYNMLLVGECTDSDNKILDGRRISYSLATWERDWNAAAGLVHYSLFLWQRHVSKSDLRTPLRSLLLSPDEYPNRRMANGRNEIISIYWEADALQSTGPGGTSRKCAMRVASIWHDESAKLAFSKSRSSTRRCVRQRCSGFLCCCTEPRSFKDW